MFRIDVPTATGVLPAPAAPGTPGYFSNGNPATSTPATIVDQDFLNSVQEELANIALATGGSLSKTTRDQCLTAIKQLLQVQGSAYSADTGGAANVYVGTYSPAITAYTDGMVLRLFAANSNTGASTFNGGAGAKNIVRADGTPLQQGDIVANSFIALQRRTSSDNFYLISRPQSAGTWPPGTLSGLTLSRASATTFGIAVGYASNENAGARFDMALGSAFTKSLSAWAAGTGNGGLDTGTVANNTWYHVHLIRKDSDGTIDVLYSLSATNPTMPSGYTARRRLGSFRTDGSGNIIDFTQEGDEFLWKAAVIDLDATNPGTAAVTRTLTVPTGVKVRALISAGAYSGTNTLGAWISSLDANDQVAQDQATAALANFLNVPGGETIAQGRWQFAPLIVRTNTSAQIRSRVSASAANDRLGIITQGWLDRRGKE